MSAAATQTPVLRFLLDAAGTRRAAALLTMSAVMCLLDLVGIGFIFPYLDAVARPDATVNQLLGAWLSEPDRRSVILVLSACLITFYFLKNGVQAFLLRYQYRQLSQFTQQLTDDTVSLILHARYALFQKTAASGIASAAFAYTVHAMNGFQALIQAATEVLFLCLLLLGFVAVQPMLALSLVGALGILAGLLYFTIIRRSTALGRSQAQIETRRYRMHYSMVNAVRDIKIMGLAPLFENHNREISANYANVAWRYNLYSALPRLFIEVVILVGLIVFVAVFVSMNVSIERVVPMVGVAVIAALRTVPAFSRLVGAVHNYRFSKPVVERLIATRADLLAAQTARTDDGLCFEQSLELRGISFRYGESQTLRNVGITVRRGQSVGIVGPSGSGKTTLLDLITGLQPAASGEFLCDGRPYDPFTSRGAQQLIGYVPQVITLLDETIAFNISFEHRPDPERLQRAIRVANLEQFVASLPERAETQVGENGLRLSGGQRQRVGIARAIYRNPAILIFDEATSSLDTISESELTAEIAQLRGGITKIIVTHRLSTIVDCDRIYVLSRGMVVDSGTHKELLTRCTLYRQLNALEEELPVLQNAAV